MSETGSKSAAKNAKTDAGKAAKKRPDPTGLELILKGDAAMAAKDFAAAVGLYEQAKAACEASDAVAAPKEKKPKAPPTQNTAAAAAETAEPEEEKKPKLMLSLPTANLQAKPLREGVDAAHNYALNTEASLKAHLTSTGGLFRTRFPPEPNGYLHIGHAKAMNFNFGQARIGKETGSGGETVMRFDDTNPAAEKQEFIDSILDNVKWLGHTPSCVTYSSDYFGQLYELAVKLIEVGGAYVCHQTGDEIKESRNILKAYHAKKKELPAGSPAPPLPAGAASPYRERSAAENKREFLKMKQGRYDEGAAFLRMRTDLLSENTSLWDPAAYRVLFHAHPRTGDAWCIYPTYDYTHCIVDSLENITHSLCTLEFEIRQAVDGPYYWLLDALKLYKPVTWEYSRLNLTHALMSKRKLKHLVTGGYVSGWDDPRMVTLDGLRRRGYSASVVNKFCEAIGVTRSRMTARIGLLEQIARLEFDTTAPRRFAVLKPLKVTLTDMPEGGKTFSMANHPKDESFGSRSLALTSPIYIETDDFHIEDDPKFFGLAPGKAVGLLGAGVNITCTSVEKDASGNITGLVAKVDASATRPKPKGHLHWVAAQSGVAATVRVYTHLFLPEYPEEAAAELGGEAEAEDDEGDGDEEAAAPAAGPAAEPAWTKLVNADSLVTCSAFVETALAEAAAPPPSHTRPTFQFQRLGYFCVDSDSTAAVPVFNRVVALKEDKEKGAAK